MYWIVLLLGNIRVSGGVPDDWYLQERHDLLGEIRDFLSASLGLPEFG
jgi:hypothetical protein